MPCRSQYLFSDGLCATSAATPSESSQLYHNSQSQSEGSDICVRCGDICVRCRDICVRYKDICVRTRHQEQENSAVFRLVSGSTPYTGIKKKNMANRSVPMLIQSALKVSRTSTPFSLGRIACSPSLDLLLLILFCVCMCVCVSVHMILSV